MNRFSGLLYPSHLTLVSVKSYDMVTRTIWTLINSSVYHEDHLSHILSLMPIKLQHIDIRRTQTHRSTYRTKPCDLFPHLQAQWQAWHMRLLWRKDYESYGRQFCCTVERALNKEILPNLYLSTYGLGCSPLNKNLWILFRGYRLGPYRHGRIFHLISALSMDCSVLRPIHWRTIIEGKAVQVWRGSSWKVAFLMNSQLGK